MVKMKRVKVVLMVAGTAVLIIAAWWGIRWYGDYQFEKKWVRVQAGMTEEEVAGILGEPVYRARYDDGSGGEWVYRVRRWWEPVGRKRFPYVGIGGVMHWDRVVYFSSERKVVKKRE